MTVAQPAASSRLLRFEDPADSRLSMRDSLPEIENCRHSSVRHYVRTRASSHFACRPVCHPARCDAEYLNGKASQQNRPTSIGCDDTIRATAVRAYAHV